MTAVPAPEPGPPQPGWLHRLRDVRERGDRRATSALVATLLTGALDEELHEEVTDTLCVLEDLRCQQQLTDVLLAGREPLRVRESVLRILTCLPCDDPPAMRVAAWLSDSDPLVRAHGATFLVPRDEERLAAVMRDPAAVVRRAGSESLVASVRTPLLVATLRHALRDPDPVVRELACRAALFDEPIGATYDLLHLLDDPDPDVRCGVYDALEDYPCVAVLLALADARAGPDGELAAVTLAMLTTRISAALATGDEGGIERILRWLGPARWVLEEDWDPAMLTDVVSATGDEWAPDSVEGFESLADSEIDEERCDSPPNAYPEADADPEADSGGPRQRVDLAQAQRVLTDPDGPPSEQRDLLVARDWGATGASGLALLSELATAPAWSLRHGAAVALFDLLRSGERGAGDVLLRLARDVEPVVRRIGLHTLTHARDPRVLDPARETLADPGSRHLAGDAALHAIVALDDRDAAEAAIRSELHGGPDRDGLRLGAVRLAERLEARGLVDDLRQVVEAPVVAGVAVHVAALRALRLLDPLLLDPLHKTGASTGISLAHLEGVDHLDVQVELGAWGWHGRRYG